ncbi:MAG: AAA family ATPase [Planctomycetaceae bacterium]
MLLDQLDVLKSSGLLTASALLEWEGQTPEPVTGFVPRAPESLEQAGVPLHLIESLVLKLLLNRGTASGREIASQLCLPFRVLDEFLRQLKKDQLVAHRCSAPMQDYVYELTSAGHERGTRHLEQTSYSGATPVSHGEWVKSVEKQSLQSQSPNRDDLRRALGDLVFPERLLRQVGQAVTAAKAMFLYGLPGNGKTSIAQKICSAFGKHIWIPRALVYDGEIVRLFDPIVHRPAPAKDDPSVDPRWIRIVRPTVIAGGELTLEQLELTVVGRSNIVEAPLQMKSNCGLLVIDDFGRQRCSPAELLNRWIVPLETGFDYLNLPSGKKICVPFEQMIVFSTNLAPRDLVDEAFLRRIPYKIEAPNPTEEEFRRIFNAMAEKLGIPFDPATYDEMVRRHFRDAGRGFRCCHPRDLLQQIKTFCKFENRPAEMTRETMEAAVENYFVNLDR